MKKILLVFLIFLNVCLVYANKENNEINSNPNITIFKINPNVDGPYTFELSDGGLLRGEWTNDPSRKDLPGERIFRGDSFNDILKIVVTLNFLNTEEKNAILEKYQKKKPY